MALVNARRTASLVGPQGLQGAQGSTGTPGAPGAPGALTQTTANYTQPAVSSTVTVNVNSTAPFVSGNYVAQGLNYYTVSVVIGPTQMSLQLVQGAVFGTLFAAPATISVVGPPGPTGLDGPAGSTGSQGLAGTNGASGVIAPVYFAALSTTTPPVSGHGITFIDGYSARGDGGQGYFVWDALSTAAADQGTVVQVTGVSTGRWRRDTTNTDGFNAKHFGAKGDTTQDDYPALSNAITAWAAAQAVGAGYAGGLGGVKLKIPAGNYYCSSPLVVSGVVGGVIEGDGMYATLINGYPSFAVGFLELRDCKYVTVRDLGIQAANGFTTLAANVSAGASSFTVASTAVQAGNIAAGHRLALLVQNGPCEECHVTQVVGTTVYVATPLLYSYTGPAGTYVVDSVGGAVACTSHYQTSTKASHGNKFERVLMNSAGQLQDGLYCFQTYPLGGGPVFLTANSNIGDTSITVGDATQLYVGQQFTISDNGGTVDSTKTISAVTITSGLVTFSPSCTVTHTANTSYVVSASDVNNDEHVLTDCVFLDAAIAGVGLSGINSLNVLFINCEQSGSYANISARQGGSFKWFGGDASGQYTDWELGGPQSRPSSVTLHGSESPARCLLVHAQDNTSFFRMWFDRYDKKGWPGSACNIIDVTATYQDISFHSCNLANGISSGYGMNFVDSTTTGDVGFSGKCWIGPTLVTLNGVLLTDFDSYWTSISGYSPPTETTLNGGGVRSIAANYNVHGPSSGGVVERRPKATLTLVNGANDSVVLRGDYDHVATGPTGAYTLKGFAYGAMGQRVRIKFNINQQLTVVNNSSVSYPILTGTGANVVFAAPGGFLFLDFWFDGTNWNVV